TLVDYSGNVVSDSMSNPSSMSSHLDRPEIHGALQSGYGEDIRKSETTGETAIYVALPLNKTYIIRLSMPMSTASSFISAMLPVTILVCLMLLAFIFFFSNRLSKKLVSPFSDINATLSALVAGNFHEKEINDGAFPELTPAISSIRSLAVTLQSNVDEIVRGKAQLDNLLKSAADGILLLAEDGEVISINDAARVIMSAPTDVANFRLLCRNKALADLVFSALHDGKERVWELDMSETRDRYYRVYVNPAKSESGSIGAVVFLSDITEVVRLEHMRSEFFANASHELKSPLTSIKGFSELLASDLVTSREMSRDYAARIVAESDRLLSLINDLLRLSELESVSANTRLFEQLDLTELSREVSNALDAQAAPKNIKIVVEGEGKLSAERAPIYQMIYNLVDNAIKYGRENGEVLITVRDKDGKISLSVYDNGIGIAAEHLPRIFERFYKTDTSRSRKEGSTGLGLAIVKHTAQRYGGTVSVKSQEAEFTEITVTFT
ncbi:MAG: ATP-binding protein, partial [Clostridia bacterium]